MRGSIILIIGFIILVGVYDPVSATMYRWTDQKGIEHITNTPPPPDAKNIRTYGEDNPAPPASKQTPPAPALKPDPSPRPKPAPGNSVQANRDAQKEAEMLKCVPLGALFINSMKEGIIVTDMNDTDLATIGINRRVWEDLSKSKKKKLLKDFRDARRECEGEGTIVLKDIETGQTLGLATPQGIELLK